MAITDFSGLTINNPQVGTQLTKVTDSPSDWTSVANSTYFYDKTNKLVYYKNPGGIIIDPFELPLSSSEVWRGFTFNNNSTTVVSDGGLTSSASASNVAQSVASTDYVSKQIRLRYYASIVQTGRYTGLRSSSLLWFIHGGFRFVCDFSVADTVYGSTCQQFYGMAGQTTDLAYGTASLIQVSTLTNLFGVGNDAADANLQIIYNDATGTASKIDLGAAFPANRTAGAAMTTMYSIMMYNAPGSTSVIYKVTNNETQAIAQGVLTTDLPATTQGLNIFASRAMGTATTNTGQFDLSKLGCYSLV